MGTRKQQIYRIEYETNHGQLRHGDWRAATPTKAIELLKLYEERVNSGVKRIITIIACKGE
jgi:hypothetical protein